MKKLNKKVRPCGNKERTNKVNKFDVLMIPQYIVNVKQSEEIFMNLYEINQEILNAINNLEVDENGEILSTSKLDELQEMFETKCENIACYIKNIKADIDALKAEEKKLQERRRVLEHKADRLKDYLSTAMQNTGNTNITTARAAMSFRKSNVVEVDDSFVKWALVRNEKLLTFKTPEPNKKEIKKLIESGEDVPYAAIVEHQNLQIK